MHYSSLTCIFRRCEQGRIRIFGGSNDLECSEALEEVVKLRVNNEKVCPQYISSDDPLSYSPKESVPDGIFIVGTIFDRK